MSSKLEKLNLSEMVTGRLEQVQNVSVNFLQSPRDIIRWQIAAVCNAGKRPSQTNELAFWPNRHIHEKCDPAHSIDLAATQIADGDHLSLYLLFGGLCEVCRRVLNLLRPSCNHFRQLYFFEFGGHFTDLSTFIKVDTCFLWAKLGIKHFQMFRWRSFFWKKSLQLD